MMELNVPEMPKSQHEICPQCGDVLISLGEGHNRMSWCRRCAPLVRVNPQSKTILCCDTEMEIIGEGDVGLWGQHGLLWCKKCGTLCRVIYDSGIPGERYEFESPAQMTPAQLPRVVDQ
jgi:hypothetical protein